MITRLLVIFALAALLALVGQQALAAFLFLLGPAAACLIPVAPRRRARRRRG